MVSIKKSRTSEEQTALNNLWSRGIRSTAPVSTAQRGETRATIREPGEITAVKVSVRAASPVAPAAETEQRAPAPPPGVYPQEEQERVVGRARNMKAVQRLATPADLEEGEDAPDPSPLEEEFAAAFQELHQGRTAPVVGLGVVTTHDSQIGAAAVIASRSTVLPSHLVVMGADAVPSIPGVVTYAAPMPPTLWARFHYAAVVLSTEYVLVLDQDVAPAPGWIEAAIEHVQENPEDIVAVSGLVRADGYDVIGVVGPGNEPSELTRVLIGTQGWLLRREHLIDALAQEHEEPTDLGWDVHLSMYTTKKKNGHVVVLPYTKATAGTTAPPMKHDRDKSYEERWEEYHDRYYS